ncbi:MAG: hypothetical protein AMXMBFR13_06010 [Phycisphaerae bacterium]
MRQYRPDGYRGKEDSRLIGLSKELLKLLRETQKSFSYDSLRLRKSEIQQLAEVLVEFAEDVHSQIGIWAAYERYNREFFGAGVPFAPTDEADAGISFERIRHLLWVLYPELTPGLIVSPRHQDLLRMAEAAHAFLNAAFRAVPKGSGIKSFLQTPNQHGWQIKRKLIWLGTCSYMFRLPFRNYLDENNRSRWEIGHVDDFLCQECTRWSGLGAIDILAGVLDISAEDQRELRGWHERHASFYRVEAIADDRIDTINVISNRAYQIRIDMPKHPFQPGQLIFGSVVPWRGEWYWSGEQEAWTNTAGIDVEGVRDTMRRENSAILCRFWKEYREQVEARAEDLRTTALAYHGGKDLVTYPNGLAMAADWQKEMRAAWESRSPEQIRQVAEKHGLKEGRPDMSIPPEVLEHKEGIGVFLHPVEGKEIMCGFQPLIEGLKRGGADLTEEQEEAIQQFIDLDAISPDFVRRVLAAYGAESVKAAFRLPGDAPEYWLEYLLRSRKGHFYRKRYPAVAVV